MSEAQDLTNLDEDETVGAPESEQASVEESSLTAEDASTASVAPDPSESPSDPTGGIPEASPVEFPEVAGAAVAANLPLERIYDLQVPVSVELGRSNLSVQDLLQLGPGAVIELDQGADAPVSMYVHGKCVAKGEIVVVDEYYGVRITSVG